MLTFQCRDGGWAAFDKDRTKSILEKVPFADHNAMLDPECADITARILECWVTRVIRHPSPNSGCVAVSQNSQEADGSWFGRWGELHLRNLAGASRLEGAQHRHDPTVAAPGPRLAAQRTATDGGWGERCNTYDDPIFRVRDPAPFPDGLGCNGLCAFGDLEDSALRRGIEYLVRTQNPDGSGPRREPGSPGLLSQIRHVSEFLATLALATYRKFLKGGFQETPE